MYKLSFNDKLIRQTNSLITLLTIHYKPILTDITDWNNNIAISCSDVVTESGRNCSFPFDYRGQKMATCTTLDSVPEDEVRLWCDVDGRGDWDYCITTTS